MQGSQLYVLILTYDLLQTEYVLDLVPFGAVPHIPFENIKLGSSAVRTVIVRNKTNKSVHVSS